MRKSSWVMSIFLLVVLSCDKVGFDGKLSSNEYLIFGKYHFECGGNCVNMYKIENQQLFPDELDWGLPAEIPFSDIPMEASKYDIARVLMETFPNALFESSKRKYGCPDCGDQGGFYIRLSADGNTNTWLIDVWDDEQPASIITYKKKIDEVLDALR